MESSAEFERTSVVEGAEFQAEDDDLLAEGMGTFVKRYGEGLPVCLSSPVTHIDYGNNGVRVKTLNNNRYYEGRKALVTVPAGILKARKIQFEPPLPPAKLTAIDKLPMGTMQKRQPPTPGCSTKTRGHRVPGGDLAWQFEAECKNASQETLKSPRAADCDKKAIDHAKGALRKMFPKEERTIDALGNENIYVTRWSLDEWTRGAYSVALPGSWRMREELAQPIPYRTSPSDTTKPLVYFAGEACAAPMYNGSFAGAYLTGLKAARDMLDELSNDNLDNTVR